MSKGKKTKLKERKGSLTNVLQEKARPWRDPAVEYLLESTKDWSDKRQQQGIRKGRKRKAGISKLQYTHFTQTLRPVLLRHSISVQQGNNDWL